MKTVWVEDEFGNLRFKCGEWTLTRWASKLDKIDAQSSDGNVDLDIWDCHIVVKGESHGSWSSSAESVHIPFPVLRAILEVAYP